jgi:hypothetical protein
MEDGMCGEPDEYADVYNVKWRKARKEHKCSACKEMIRAGDRYSYTSGVFDGSGFSYKHCVRCYLTMDMLDEITGEFPDPELNCGQVYDGENEELLALAFMLPSDGQRWWEKEHGRRNNE